MSVSDTAPASRSGDGCCAASAARPVAPSRGCRSPRSSAASSPARWRAGPPGRRPDRNPTGPRPPHPHRGLSRHDLGEIDTPPALFVVYGHALRLKTVKTLLFGDGGEYQESATGAGALGAPPAPVERLAWPGRLRRVRIASARGQDARHPAGGHRHRRDRPTWRHHPERLDLLADSRRRQLPVGRSCTARRRPWWSPPECSARCRARWPVGWSSAGPADAPRGAVAAAR